MNRPEFLLGTGAAVAAATAGPPARLTVGFTSRSATNWGYYCADKAGYFTAAGLALELIVIGSTAAATQQLTAGSLDLGSASSTQIVQAVSGGAPVVEIFKEVTTAPYFVLGRKGLTSVAQLRGKTVIVGGPGDITRLFMDKIVTANNLRLDEVTYTYAGATADRFAALVSGSVDAAMLLPPFAFRASDEGYPVVAEVAKYLPHFPFAGIAARTSWAASNAAVLIAFAKAYLQGLRWLNDPTNRTAAVQILADITNTKADDAGRTYDLYVRKLQIYASAGRYDRGDFPPIIELLAKTGQLGGPPPAPGKLYDNRYVDAATAQLRRKG